MKHSSCAYLSLVLWRATLLRVLLASGNTLLLLLLLLRLLLIFLFLLHLLLPFQFLLELDLIAHFLLFPDPLGLLLFCTFFFHLHSEDLLVLQLSSLSHISLVSCLVACDLILNNGRLGLLLLDLGLRATTTIITSLVLLSTSKLLETVRLVQSGNLNITRCNRSWHTLSHN